MPNTNEFDIIAGRNAVAEAIKADRRIDRILIASGTTGTIDEIIGLAKEAKITVKKVSREELDRRADQRHQGIIALVEPYRYSSVAEILKTAEEKEEDPFLIVCDSIEDPHNLGAILRTAECAGAHGVIIGKRRSATINETVRRASAGATEHILCAQETNIARAVEALKEKGIWMAACDMGGQRYDGTDLTGPIGLVIGNEGKGLHQLVKKQCDFVLSIPLYGRIQSLNASNAAAILMYEVRRQRNGA